MSGARTCRTWSGQLLLILASVCLAAAFIAGCREERPGLPRLGAAIDATSASGISSGAYMAGQLQLAHSSIMVGAAIIAGGPFGCAESVLSLGMPGPGAQFLNATRAINLCMLGLWGTPDTALLARRAERLAAAGEIDPLPRLARHRIYLFSGTADHVVVPRIVTAAAELYARLGVPAGQIRKVLHVPAGHAIITEQEGLACEKTAKPFIVSCGYDQAGDLLSQLYGPLAPRSPAPTGELVSFDQGQFARDLPLNGLAATGLVYVPADCRRTRGCRIHVAFHGCGQSRALVGDAFIAKAGYQRWADTNRIVVLFPQVAIGPTNPQACWDWWGYTGSRFLTREAPQIKAVRRMIDHLASAP